MQIPIDEPFATALRFRSKNASGVPFAGCDTGVAHPPKALSDVRRADARSAQIGGPDGISQCFQVSSYSGEPNAAILARNLFSKDDCRMALGDEPMKSGP